VATGIPCRTLSRAMKTMTTLMAANTPPPQCPTNIISIYKASPPIQELTALKSSTCGINSSSSPIWSILWEIPTRNSPPTQATAVIDFSNGNDDQHQHKTLPHIWTNLDTTNNDSQQQTLVCNNKKSFDYRLLLNELTTECDQMQQCCQLMVALIDQGHCNVKPDDSSSSISLFPPADLYPWPTNTNLTTTDALCHHADSNTTTALTSLLTQSMRFPDNLKQQSMALWHLTALSKELCKGMGLLLHVLPIPNPCPPPNCYAHIPLHHHIMVTANFKITPTPVIVPAIHPKHPSSTQPPDNLLPQTNVTPWPPPPPVCLLKPTQPPTPLPWK